MKSKKISTKNTLYYNLTEEEIKNPYLLIIDSFSWDFMPQQLSRLKYWRELLLVEQYYEKRNCPADLYFQYKMVIKMLEAAWLLRKKNRTQTPTPESSLVSAQNEPLKSEDKRLLHSPTFLNPSEILNPYNTFRSIFAEFHLTEYHDILDRWLSEGLSSFYCESILEKKEVITVYENLQKLIEAMYLIHERELNEGYES